MSAQEYDLCDSREINIQKALNAYNLKKYTSILKAARAFAVFYLIMKNRVFGRISQAQAQKSAQNLLNAEETILIRWLIRFIITGFPTSSKLALQMAEEIRYKRVFLAPQFITVSLGLRPIGYNWFTRFKQRNPEISDI